MDKPCPNCGNRQHAPSATNCRVCGQPLGISESLPSSSTSGNDLRLPAGQGQYLSPPLNPLLTDRNGRRYGIHTEKETVIGSLPSADISLQRPNVQPRHARLYLVEGQMVVEALIGCLVLVNGRAISRSARLLHDRDIITIGSNQFLYQENSVNTDPSLPATTHYQTDDGIVGRPNVRRVPTYQPAPHDCDLYGRVLHVDGPYMEDPDPSLGRALASAAKFAFTMWKPAAIFIFGQPNKQVPVRYLRVEMTDGQVGMVKMKGNLFRGAVHTGDTVLFWGEWQNGTLLMHRGFNVTIQSDVLLKQ